jgi:PST family polysaccharide transporter
MRKSVQTLYLALIINQGANLALLPFLSRVLGVEGFGSYSLLVSVALFGQMFLEYGIPFLGTREVARVREESHKVATLLGKVLLARTLLFVAVVSASIFFTYKSLPRETWAVANVSIAIWYLGVLVNISWLYQGLERMRIVAWMEVLPKVGAFIATLILVRSSEQYFLPILLQGALSFLVGLIAVARVVAEFGSIKVVYGDALQVLKESFPAFLYRVGVQLFVGANVLILGLVGGVVQVAYYSAAEKLVRPWLSLIDPLNRAVYPRVAWLIKEGKSLRPIVRKSVMLAFLLGCGITAMVWVGGQWIIKWFLGDGYGDVLPIVRVMTLLLMPAFVSKVLAAQVVLASGGDTLLYKVYLGVGLANLLMVGLVAKLGGALWVAALAVVAETSVLVLVGVIALRWWRAYALKEGGF